ncbi:MAG: hypothetical protein CVU51_10370 [Deltaproteobacteria bacterium HGW-Deltaproteobacteria-1]|nr:MAG: hypothetical protein CVU51_10370 [Deltaproteobacteria bacterium HGW-Deltaproteobacteria-1]
MNKWNFKGKNALIVMNDKRRIERLKKNNEVTITIVSDGETNSKGKVVLGHSKDVSVLGTKIQVNYFLPVDSLLKIDFTFKDLYNKITAIGKVRWIRTIFGDESYEAGVEFVNLSPEEIEKQVNYISGKFSLS